MSRVAISTLAPFGITDPRGAFTTEDHGRVLFLLIENGGNGARAYNTTDRSVWDFTADTMVSPADHVGVFAPTDDGSGFNA